jgi:hypothetical protein
MSDLETTNALIARFSAAHQTTMRAERRATMQSALFDLPRRSSLGYEAVYEHGGELIRELKAAIDPEELGRRMRGVGQRPYTLQIFMLILGYLAGRQQHLLDAGLRPGEAYAGDDLEEIGEFVEYWAAILHGQRDGDSLMPEENGGATQVVDADELAVVRELLEPADADRRSRVRKMSATLELYGFILHGEQRDGIGGHGPYAGPGGTTLFFKEFNDLRNQQLPWAGTDVRNPHGNVVVAYAARDVEVRCDLFGSMVIEPHELGDRVEGLAVLTRDAGGVLHRLDDAGIEAVRDAASHAQQELYMRAITWDARYKVAYGAPLYANHLATLFELAGIAGAYPRIAALFERTADRVADSMLAADVPSLWRLFGQHDDDYYWPIAPTLSRTS